MKVLAFEATDFRNLQKVFVEPHSRFNVFHGDNAQGKTNLLEAVYLLGTLRSFRAARTDEMIAFGAETASVRARVEKLGTTRLLEVALQPGHKSARVDGKGARGAQYFGGFNVVLFAPEDLRLPKGPPSGRRRFLDRAIFNAQTGYLDEVQTYELILKSRNAVLREGGRADLLEVYDAQLAQAAVPLVERRRALVGELAPFVRRAFERVTQTGLMLEIAYRSTLEGEGDIGAVLLQRLGAERARDLARGATSSGPHTDDLELCLGDHDAGAFASQGQLRATVLALKIAEIEYLSQRLGDAPVLLLDDVSSELDPTRNQQLFSFLQTVPCQTFITTTRPQHVLLSQERQDFTVEKGVVSGQNRP
jgi:DNA replication and repair protein RecF